MNIVIVESPAKAKTINEYLGHNYKVMASYGHVRDLPAQDGSVQPEADFKMIWEVNQKAQKHLDAILAAVKNADRLILATDPDREGEAISWHVLEILQSKHLLSNVSVERVVFNAITKTAVLNAVATPRQIDMALVEAYLARRALDYLFGFNLSPVLWRKLPGARSAGRVQSVSLRLVCQREHEIETFVRQEYWSLIANIATEKGTHFKARLVSADGQKVERLSIRTREQAEAIHQALTTGHFSIQSIETKPIKRNPSPPFTTSSLQQEASRKLGLPPSRTMQIAQRLYEGVKIGSETQGLITYMRTDGVQIAPEALTSCRETIEKHYGKKYLPESPRLYKAKAKNAQEAHEAVRPTDLSRLPESVAPYLDHQETALYSLIWKRTLASQMSSAELARTSIEISVEGGDNKPYGLRAVGSVITFEGFLSLYQEENEEDDDETRLPHIEPQEGITLQTIEIDQHFTEPPGRYTEASLIKKMEEIGIGRPSTYASTLSVLNERGYVQTEKKTILPADRGRLVTAFLESFFKRYVESDFTADLEARLDLVSDQALNWKSLLNDFWQGLHEAIQNMQHLRVSDVLEELNIRLASYIFPPLPDGSDPRKCPVCSDGRLSLKIGKFGTFIGCSNYPNCSHTRQISNENSEDSPDQIQERLLGIDPETGLNIQLKTGRFGPYVERAPQDDEKPARAGIPAGVSPEHVDLAYAISLLSLPREVGIHPETGMPISTGIGRYGPFLLHEGVYTNLDNLDDVFIIGLNHAVALLADRKLQNRASRSRQHAPLRILGNHPEEGGEVQILAGRYGSYVKHGKINATLPRNTDPETMTLEEALSLIRQKAEKGAVLKKGQKSKTAKSDSANSTKSATRKKKITSKGSSTAKQKPVNESKSKNKDV